MWSCLIFQHYCRFGKNVIMIGFTIIIYVLLMFPGFNSRTSNHKPMYYCMVNGNTQIYLEDSVDVCPLVRLTKPQKRFTVYGSPNVETCCILGASSPKLGKLASTGTHV